MHAPTLSPAQIAALLDAGRFGVALDLCLPMAACASRHPATARVRAYDHVRRHASAMPRATASLRRAFGVDVQGVRGVLSPLDTFAAGLPLEALAALMQALDAAARDAHLDALVGLVGSCESAEAVRVLPTALARTERLHASFDAAPLANALLPEWAAALDAARPHAPRLALTVHAPQVPGAGVPRVDLTVRADAPPSPERLLRRVAGLARAGALLAAHAARTVEQASGQRARPGTVHVALHLPAPSAALPPSPGALAWLRRASDAAAQGARLSAALAHLVLPAGTSLPQAAAVVDGGAYPCAALPTPDALADLAAVCVATGHAAHLTFTS